MKSLREQQSAARAEGRYFGIGFATYAELTGIGSRISAAPGHADQHRLGDRQDPPQFDRRGYPRRLASPRTGRGWRRRSPRSSPTISARNSRISASCRATAMRCRCRPELTPAAARFWAAVRQNMPHEILREKIKKVASHLLEASADDIEVNGGLATVTGTDRAVTFRQIAKAVYSDMKTLPVEARQELEASYTYDPINGTTAARHASRCCRGRSRRPAL